MTAGHCADGASSVELMLGAHNVREDAEEGRYNTVQNSTVQYSTVHVTCRMEITSTEIFKHESYNPFLIHNDIALIHLPQPIEFNGS